MRVRCNCGRIASTWRPCKVCTHTWPMVHQHGEVEHAHPHDGLGHDHPEDNPVVKDASSDRMGA